MNLAPLLSAFPPDGGVPAGTSGPKAPPEVAPIVAALGGVSLAGGLYRVFTPREVEHWTAVAREGFPQFGHRVTVFAADWLGRLFATDAGRLDATGAPLVLLLEPGTGQVLEVPVTLEALHTTELLQEADAALAVHFYEEWRATSGDADDLTSTECVGYRVPLFLGGSDTTDNVERTDMDVYWALATQMHQQLAGVPLGTPVESASITTAKRGLFRRNR